MSKIGVAVLVLCSAHGLTPFSPRAASVVTRGAAGARCSIRSVAPRALDNDRDNDSNDAALVADDAEASSLPEFMRAFDAWGLGLKARAYAARDGAGLAPDGTRALALRCKFAGLLALFIVYRAYRGFFVVLPAVYGEVYAQALAQATEEHVSIRGVEVADDIDPKTGKLRLRSRVVMNVGALAFMGALVVGGAVRAPIRIAAACLRKVGLLPRESTEATPADRLAAKEKELDLPPLPDIPDDVPPDTDDV